MAERRALLVPVITANLALDELEPARVPRIKGEDHLLSYLRYNAPEPDLSVSFGAATAGISGAEATREIGAAVWI